jgi:hypothetical protein
MVDRSVPDSTKFLGASEGLLEQAVEQVEEIFMPRPDGMIAKHRAERARREAAAREQENINERVEEHSYKGVKTVPLKPETTTVNTVIIQPGQAAQLLPLSMYRYRATLSITPPQYANPWIGNNTPSTPAVPASTVGQQNMSSQPAVVVISGGTITQVTVNGITAGTGPGTYIVPVGAVIAITYSVAPTWAWAGFNGITNGYLSIPYVLLSKNNGQAISQQGLPLAVNQQFVIESRAQLYGYNPTNAAITVVVLSELNAPEV